MPKLPDGIFMGTGFAELLIADGRDLIAANDNGIGSADGTRFSL